MHTEKPVLTSSPLRLRTLKLRALFRFQSLQPVQTAYMSQITILFTPSDNNAVTQDVLLEQPSDLFRFQMQACCSKSDMWICFIRNFLAIAQYFSAILNYP